MFAYLDKIAGGKATLYFMGFPLSYRPPSGLAAAKIDVRALRVAWTEKAGESSAQDRQS